VIERLGSGDPRAFLNFFGIDLTNRNTPRAGAEIRDAVFMVDGTGLERMAAGGVRNTGIFPLVWKA
jgi:hypothetical protein